MATRKLYWSRGNRLALITEVLAVDFSKMLLSAIILPEKGEMTELALFDLRAVVAFDETANTRTPLTPRQAVLEIEKTAFFRLYEPFDLETLFERYEGPDNVPNPVPFPIHPGAYIPEGQEHAAFAAAAAKEHWNPTISHPELGGEGG